MCTVTYVPTATGCFLTSSRDEKAGRAKALPPAVYHHLQQQLLYPKDEAANGTWIAITKTGTAAVLLNGAFEKHVVNPVYRKSRGLIFLEIVSHENPLTGFGQVDLDHIEPFTLVLFFDQKLFECRWDGEQKHLAEMDVMKRHIWSSVTLYTNEMILERNAWFYEWCAAYPSPKQQDILNFHQFGGNGNTEKSIRMNRNNYLLTVSITSIHVAADEANMIYSDLQENERMNQRKIPFKSLATT